MSSRVSSLLTVCAFAILGGCADKGTEPAARLLTAPTVRPAIIASSRSDTAFLAPTCNGEALIFFGQMQSKTHWTIDNNGGYHFGMHLNGLFSATGSTGINYQMAFNEVLPVNTNSGGSHEFTFLLHERVISTGKTPNLLFDLHLHTTVNANGEPTSQIDDVREVCRG